MENKICVYAICKNEEQFVDRWYESMKEADLIVVLDTGSTDHTVEYLKKYENIIVESKEIKPWRFDVARNISLDMIPEEYNILVCTDLDEFFEPGWATLLRDNWQEGVHHRANYSYAWSHLENGDPGRVFHYDKIHSRSWRWKYPVHEMLYRPETNNTYSGEETLYLFDQIKLHHFPDKNKSRAQYLPLLELRAKEDPQDYYGLIYLAHEYYYREKYGDSIDLLIKIINNYKDHYNNMELASCHLFIGDSFLAMADKVESESEKEDYRDSAILAYQDAIRLEKTYREPYLNIAKAYLAINDYDNAEYYLKLSIKKTWRHYTWLERDTSWTYEPWDLLCLATYYGNKRKESIMYAAKALSYEPDNERLRKNLELCINGTNDYELI